MFEFLVDVDRTREVLSDRKTSPEMSLRCLEETSGFLGMAINCGCRAFAFVLPVLEINVVRTRRAEVATAWMNIVLALTWVRIINSSYWNSSSRSCTLNILQRLLGDFTVYD
jgi:hypothetical protein